MAVKFQDYYKTLGVQRNASQDEIHKAYRKLARKVHPDVNKEADAEQRFKQLSEAYEVLKDPEKRKRYDELGENWKSGQDFRPPPGYERFSQGARDFQGRGFRFHTSGGGMGGDFSDFFEMFFGQGGGFASAAGAGRSGAHAGGYSGGGSYSGGDAFESIRQAMGGGNGRTGSAGTRHGAGSSRAPSDARMTQAQVDISLYEAFHGTTRQLTLQGPEGTQNIDVKIPAGTTDGSRMRLRDKGIMLTVRVASDPRFSIEGRNLVHELSITPWEAGLGAKVAVPTMDGTVEMTVPAGSSSGQKLRLKGRGLPNPKGEPGDMLVKLKIVMPSTLTDKQRGLLEELKTHSADFQPRGEP